ncbi:hypothetical protein PsorP6_011667 [Peronosclerospora sorghi]|uniref:Uncharacterized protein n=1 Tax=Peronosclerospora sorghi TaxID=230839 RepID=A0ACC0WKP7_9STRA|nr:hypothetical protein PsorP6_011667 [Peronosclerospora sorghi]
MTLDGFINGSGKRLRATEVDCHTQESLKTRIIEFFADADITWSVVERKTFKDLLASCNLKTSSMLIKHQAIMVALFEAFEMRENVKLSTEQIMHRCMAHVLNLIARDGLHEFGHVEDDEDNVEET